MLDLRPRIIHDEEHPYSEDPMGSPANFYLEPGHSLLEPTLDDQHGLRKAVVASALRARARVPRGLDCSACPFQAKVSGSLWITEYFFVTIIHAIQSGSRVYMGISKGVYF